MRCMLSRDQACYRVSLRCQHSHTRRPMLHLIAQPCMFACCLQDLKHTLMVPSCLHFDKSSLLWWDERLLLLAALYIDLEFIAHTNHVQLYVVYL